MSSGRAIALVSPAGDSIRIDGTTRSLDRAGEALSVDTSFDLASITKILATTTILMRAVDQGLVDVTEPVARFLPDWKSPDKADLTLEDLLRHESGLEEWRPFYITCKSVSEVHKKIAALPLKYPARSGFHYSDLNFITLGEVVSRIYTSNLATIFAREVVAPFGLTSTQFARPKSGSVAATSIGDSIEQKMVSTKTPYAIPEVAEEFTAWRTEILEGEINDGNSFHCFDGVAGHAGLFSTLNDLIRYSRGLIDSQNGDGPINPKTLDHFATPRLEAAQGIGFRRYPMRSAEIAIGHPGFTGTGIAINLAHGSALIYLSNRLHTQGTYLPMADIWRPELTELAELVWGSFFPGLKIPAGSKIAFIERCNSSSFGSLSLLAAPTLILPMPCSPLAVPPSPCAASIIARKARRARTSAAVSPWS